MVVVVVVAVAVAVAVVVVVVVAVVAVGSRSSSTMNEIEEQARYNDKGPSCKSLLFTALALRGLRLHALSSKPR